MKGERNSGRPYRSKEELREDVESMASELKHERERRQAAEQELETTIETIDAMYYAAVRENAGSDTQTVSANARESTLETLRERIPTGGDDGVERPDDGMWEEDDG